MESVVSVAAMDGIERINGSDYSLAEAWYILRKGWKGGGFFFIQAEDGIRDLTVTGVQTCALPISLGQEQSTQAIEIGGEGITGAHRSESKAHHRACVAPRRASESLCRVAQSVACGACTRTARTRVQSRPSSSAESCDEVRRITPSLICGQRNEFFSNRLATSTRPARSHSNSFTRSARLARNT